MSQLITDLPEIVELDINPLLVDDEGVIALDARVRVARPNDPARSGSRFVRIRSELEERIEFHGREIVLRPIRPEDEPQHARFLAGSSRRTCSLRFFHAVRAFAHAQLARFTQIDYDREMAFIATVASEAGTRRRWASCARSPTRTTPARNSPILVRSDLKGQGLGCAPDEEDDSLLPGTGRSARLVGDVLATNRRMLALARDLGFEMRPGEDPGTLRATLPLLAGSPAALAMLPPS